MNSQIFSFIKVDQIKTNPNNPNPHSKEKLKTLATNIKEFGLLNPITVKPLDDGKYEIIAGEGRFRACADILKWTEVPCQVVNDNGDYMDWGRRLSENKLRDFPWWAECIELAAMRLEGHSPKEIGALFGYEDTGLKVRIAIGMFPEKTMNKIKDLYGGGHHLSLEMVRRQILPLRLPPEKHSFEYMDTDKKGGKIRDYSKYDYSEVDKALDLLLSGKLTIEDLPSYSASKRAEIAFEAGKISVGEQMVSRISEEKDSESPALAEQRKKLEQAIREDLKKKIKADKNKEYEEELKIREQQVKAMQEELIRQKQISSKEIGLDGFIDHVNSYTTNLAYWLRYARENELWIHFDKRSFARIGSGLFAVADEFKMLNEKIKSNKLNPELLEI